LALFAGQKLRILPVGFGSATYVRSIKDEELEDISLKFLQSTQYKGLGGVEFKKDPRDNQYKLIEFNARFGLWDSLSVECGMDIPYIAYCDAINIPVESQQDYRTGILWVDFERDMRAFLIYRSRGLLSFWDWIKSFQGEVKWSVFSRYDMKPSLISIFSLLNRIKSKILKSN
jgi:predicted ATP-grasp superfamily ATP-dependent carboligase